ncbi:MAG: ABC transporter permease [Nitrososphaerales archaeon]
MGYPTFLVKKTASYIMALMATVSILYLGTYPEIQKVITASANYLTAQYQQQLIKHSSGITSTQIASLVATFKTTYLAQFGFDKPLPEKFALQIYNLLTFHFGTAYFIHAPSGSLEVTSIIAAYLPNTILLFTSGTLLLIVLGTIIGLLAARSAGSVWDRLVPFVAVVHSSLPTWWLGFLLIAGLAYGVRLFPSSGITSVPVPHNPLFYAFSVFDHMTLPLIALLIVGLGGFAYVIRSLVISTLGEDFVLTARARGLPESKVIFRHVLRTASPAIATQSILAVTGSFAGSLTTEIVFNWPGVGLLTYDAIIANDVPIIIGITFVLTIFLLIGLYIGDLVYGLLDPRIKTGDE